MEEFIDLGLPSGTLWKIHNEEGGFYGFDEAMAKFYRNNLPSKKQFEELKNSCKWEWTGEGYKVTGPNGNSIFMPAEGSQSSEGIHGTGCCGIYWSSTSNGYKDAVELYFDTDKVAIGNSDRIVYAHSVRLVTKKDLEIHITEDTRCALKEQGWVDLGLPSGTMWRKYNEKGGFFNDGLYKYDEAIAKFGNYLPTKEQFEELKSSCQWKWIGDGYKVTGPNSKSIFMPAEGYRSLRFGLSYKGAQGCYWSSEFVWVEMYPASKTYMVGDDNYTLGFDSENVHINSKNRKDFLSLRLVRQSEEAKQAYETYARKEELLKYIDLGLPSGTLWKDSNEKGKFYSYKEVEEKFGNELPTKEQFEELQNLCKWTWIGNGYDVEGLNGNKIFMPADGSRNIYGSVFGSEANGNYWSSSPNIYGRFWILEFNSSKVNIDDNKDRNLEYSVRLIR